LNLFIDSTNIINKGGVEGIGFTGPCKKKKFTKITCLSKNKEIVAVHNDKVNTKIINQSRSLGCTKKTQIKTIEHDVKAIIPVTAKVRIGKTENKLLNIVGDKGYILNEKDKADLLKNKKIKLITAFRKNQKKKNSDKDKKLLKQRIKVENAISKIKVFHRIHVRYDKKLVSYMGFLYLALIHKSESKK